MFPRALLLCAALCLAAPGLAAAEERGWDVGDVSELNFCLPISILVAPTDEKNTSILVDAEPDVAQAFVATVEDGVMGFGLDKGFVTEKAVRVTIFVPATALKVIKNAGVGNVLLSEGFESDELELVNSGAGVIVAKGLDAKKVKVEHAGAGDVPIYLEGKIDMAEVKVKGVGDIYVLGVQTSATVTIEGVSQVHISGERGMKVTGTINGLTDGVSIDNGECDLQGRSPFGPGPSCDALEDIPEPPAVEWQCGVVVDGEKDCIAAVRNGASASASTRGNAMAFADASGAGEPASAVSGPSGVGASGNAVAGRDVQCKEGEDLVIET
ncbi:unnamed protein product [Ostreobium quekettii]|uniref:Putative auto-transporter adhesin head GIN domain-containing protein n=1 Tax=Ostreobium quekettii TaxID=121088 RepID=A0A8S1JA47_9CHLO|nr:unnamed protein product [Ostreobium quekettii]